MPVAAECATTSDGLRGEHCFEYWRDVMARSRAADMTSDHVHSFTATVRSWGLGPVIVLRTSFPSVRVRRTARMIRRSDDELLHLTMLTAGSGTTATGSGERTGTVGVRELHLTSSSQPYDSRFSGIAGPPGTGSQARGIGIDLPLSLLPVPGLHHLIGRTLPVRPGMGALLAEFLLAMEREDPLPAAEEAARLGNVAVDLVSVFLARELDSEDTLPGESRHRAMLQSVRAFVRDHLDDPGLTPAVLAEAHHVSLSYLHRLFTRGSGGETLAAFIRRQRLAKAHRDLADPALSGLPIHAVGMRCGITHPSAFTRAFKAAYGLSPREHRQRAAGPTASRQGP